MKNQFINSQILGKRIITFNDKEVKIVTRHFFVGSRSRTYRLDEISHRPEYRKVNRFDPGSLFALTMISFILLIILNTISSTFSIPLVLSLIFAIYFFSALFAQEQMIEIKTKFDPIMIYLTRKTKEEGENFANDLVQASKDYIIGKFAYVDPDISATRQYENYRWLLHNDLIDQERYEKLKQTLKNALTNKKDSFDQ